MDSILEMLSRAVEQLLGRAGGPMHLRLVIQPCVASILAIRAGLRDARNGRPAFLWSARSWTKSSASLLRAGWRDIGKLFIVAVALDAGYQAYMFGTFHPLQTLIVAVAVAVVPYVLLRGLVTRIAHKRLS